MIRKRSFIYFTLGFLGIFLVSCSHHPKNAKTNYHYLKAEKSLSDRGKSIYYYLVSQVEDIAGKEEFSNPYGCVDLNYCGTEENKPTESIEEKEPVSGN